MLADGVENPEQAPWSNGGISAIAAVRDHYATRIVSMSASTLDEVSLPTQCRRLHLPHADVQRARL